MVIELANPLLAPITFPCQRRDRIKIHLAGKKERTRDPPGQNQSCTSFLSVFDSLPAPFLTFHLPPASTLSFYFLPFLFIFPFLLLFLFSRVHATLQVTLSVCRLVGRSVGRSVGLSVGRSVPLCFFCVFGLFTGREAHI